MGHHQPNEVNMKNQAEVRFANIAQEIARVAPMALATSFGNTMSGPDGGYAVPQDAAESILMPAVGALLPLCRIIPVTRGGSIELPIDLSTPYAETGIVAGWSIEGTQLPQKKPVLNMTQFFLKKLIALVPCTEELLEDSAALAAYLPLALQLAVTRRINDAIIGGSGVGQPLGILKSNALLSVAKDGGQTAATITATNIAGMLARSLDPIASTWVMNPAAYGQITALAAFDGASNTLAGLPIVTTDSCPAMGSVGDIILGDFSGYLMAAKTPELNGSSHLWFDQDTTAFKFSFRADGMPMLAAPITPPNSPVTRSHFVTIAARV